MLGQKIIFLRCTIGVQSGLVFFFGAYCILLHIENVWFAKNTPLWAHQAQKMTKDQTPNTNIANSCSKYPNVQLYKKIGQLDHFPENSWTIHSKWTRKLKNGLSIFTKSSNLKSTSIWSFLGIIYGSFSLFSVIINK